MAPPPRYFAGRAPAPASSSSDEAEAPPRPRSPARPARPAKRQRFVARVVARDEPDRDVDGDGNRSAAPPPRPSVGTFVPVRELRDAAHAPSGQSDGSDESDDDESSSGASSSSPDSPHAAVYRDDLYRDEEEEEEQEEEEQDGLLQKPVFIRREQREGKYRADAAGAAEAAARREEELAAERGSTRRREAQRLVTEVLNEEDRNESSFGLARELLPDDEDREEDREKEFALWRVRELLRLKRDREELAEWERLRSGEARGPPAAEDRDGEEVRERDVADGERKSALGPKHYKMGPFFLEKDEDGRYREEIYNREYKEGTREDTARRQHVSDAMQDRRSELGKGRKSKFTHAVEDTAKDLARELRHDHALREKLAEVQKGGAG